LNQEKKGAIMEKFNIPIIGLLSVIGAPFMGMASAPVLAGAQTIAGSPTVETSKIVELRNATVRDNVVTGEIVNNSPNRLRDVELLIRHLWHWHNEFRPGPNPPGAADYYTVRTEIPAGATERFTHTLPSLLPSRSDGRFETVVTVAGFTKIKEQPQDRRNGDDWRPVS
jgi:hypothetical protein